MKTIGIDTNNHLGFEKNRIWGHAVWSTPTILPAAIIDEFSGLYRKIINNKYQNHELEQLRDWPSLC